MPCLAIIVWHGCVESFTPETSETQGLLVVEGHISDRQESYTVQLSRSRPLTANTLSPEKGASVWVSDQASQSFEFVETAPGQYQSIPSAFVGKVGETYVLHIETADRQRYRSAPVLLKPTPPIDSVYYQPEQRLTDLGETKDGVSILVDSHDPQAQTTYYRFDWRSDYGVAVPYPSQWEYTPGVGFQLAQWYRTCYNFSRNRTILVSNTQSLNDDRVSGFEVTYVNTDGYELSTLYSILVKQYALDEAGYQFWKAVAESSEQLGSLFDPTPYQVLGNIINIERPEEPVLGYFDASSVSEKRFFISREDLSDLYYSPSPCRFQTDTIETPDELPLLLSWGYRAISIGSLDSPTIMAPEECTDCRALGSPDKPDFWPEN